MIEDNAHGHGGKVNGQLLGTFGDLGISSPRKTLKTFSGGVLWLKDRVFLPTTNLSTYPVSMVQRIKRSLLDPYPEQKNLIKKALKNRPQYEDPRALRESVILDYVIDKWTKNIIEQTDWNQLLKSRQEVFQKWQGFALNNGLTPVFKKLQMEANPWCFPAYVKDQKEAIKWFDWGWDNDIR